MVKFNKISAKCVDRFSTWSATRASAKVDHDRPRTGASRPGVPCAVGPRQFAAVTTIISFDRVRLISQFDDMLDPAVHSLAGTAAPRRRLPAHLSPTFELHRAGASPLCGRVVRLRLHVGLRQRHSNAVRRRGGQVVQLEFNADTYFRYPGQYWHRRRPCLLDAVGLPDPRGGPRFSVLADACRSASG